MSDLFTRVTILDIARELNITAATVSRALNDHPSIKDSTKQIVRQTAEKLNYQPNKIASSLRLGKSNIIGVIIPSAEISFFGSVIHGIEKIANQHNYNLLIYQSNEQFESEKKGIQTFLQSQVDGVLASISKETIDLGHFASITRRGIPLVLFDRTSDDLAVSSVVVDDYYGAFQATQHLVEQGCRRIAHISGQQHVGIFKNRKQGYIDALTAANLPVDEELIVAGDVSVASGNTCMQHLLSQDLPPDGVFAVEDFTALGAMQKIKQAGLRIPDEIAVIGFANEAFGEYLTPSLSSVNQQTARMGELAAGLFFGMPATRYPDEFIPKKIIMEPTLVLRESSLKKR